jgi:hypothetical protein
MWTSKSLRALRRGQSLADRRGLVLQMAKHIIYCRTASMMSSWRIGQIAHSQPDTTWDRESSDSKAVMSGGLIK